MLVESCRLIEFPSIADSRGVLAFAEATRHVPFEIKRLFYIFDVPAGGTRGGHAHRTVEHLLICPSGSFDVIVDDGTRKLQLGLNSPSVGLYIPPLIWDTELNFRPGSVCIVLASDYYDEKDYYRNYDEFLRAASNARTQSTLRTAPQPPQFSE
jgi:dTDP-4-dehydrorhamnose 3,5-epimerase-like enzyme